MIYAWGVNNYGLILYIISIPASLGLIIINFFSPARQEMANQHLKKKIINVRKIYSNTIILLILSYSIYFCLGLFIVNFFEIKSLENIKDIKIIFFLMFSSIGLGLITAIANLKISYLGIYHISKYLDFYFDLFIKILMILIGFYSKSILLVFQIYFLLTFLKVLFYLYFSKKNKKIIYSSKDLNLSYLKDIFKKTIPYQLIQFEEILKTQCMIALIGFYFNYEIVALMSTLRTMFYFFPRKIIEIISELLQFEYVNLFIKKKYRELKKIYVNQNLIVLFFGLFLIVISYFFGLDIYNFWTKNRFQFNENIILILVLDCFLFLMVISNISFLKSINNFRVISKWIFLSQIILFSIVFLFYENEKNYYLFFYASLVVSFLVFCISLVYFIKTLKYISKK